MRHNKKFNHLGRTSSHRNAMLSNMCVSLITHKRIFTTVAKAKALKKVIEPIITKSIDDTTHSRRLVFQALKINAAAPIDNRKIKIQKEERTRKKDVITELFQVVSQKVGDRPGGYTRIIKTGNRLGDNAEMCFIELVDFNDNMLKETKTETKGRTRRAGSKKTTTTEVGGAVEAPKKRTSKKAVEASKDAPATDAKTEE